MMAVWSLQAEGIEVFAGGPSADSVTQFRDVGCQCLVAVSPADLLNQVWAQRRVPILAVGDAVTVPENFLGRALRMMDDDLRVGSVSFLSNDAGFLSFPDRNEPCIRPPDGHDARSLTRALRGLGPHEQATPIPTAVGAAILLAPSALGLVGGFVPGPRSELMGSIADFAARARARGFVHLLDPSAYYVRHRAAGDAPYRIGTTDDLHPDDRHWVHTLYPNEVYFVDHEARSNRSPLALAHGVARAKALGIRVVVDGSYLGPIETGTQVSALATIEALSRRRDVREVVVAMRSDIPRYAREVLSLPKVTPRGTDFNTLEGIGHCDVAHRMIQPDQWFSVDRWRTTADRVVVSILDLIAYRNGAYHENVGDWLAYREAIRSGAAAADAVAVISEDVKVQVELERLPVDPERLHAIPFGTEHLTGDEPIEVPRELLARGFIDGQFILVLGTDYVHKNRDLALEVLAELRQRGHSHALVMAGPTVPHGSSRLSEATRKLHGIPPVDSEVYLLPDVPSAERNWLMHHADLVLYPSSAEGFGLVPFEAARFGTPSLFTRFGPLQEMAPDVPVAAEDWSPEALAAAADALLSDPAQARVQVESCLDAGAKYTWAATAERLTDLYRDVLSLPPR
jgi:glycosyltransferase involved in cell wall biosynthesis